jgi:membrane-associated phospholipid phosphatase
MNLTVTEKKRNKRWLKLITLEFIIISLLLITSIVIFALAVDMVFIKKATTFDENIFNFVAHYVTPGHTRFMSFITFLGNHAFLIPANLVLLTYYFFKKNRWFSIRVVALALSSLCLKLLLKLFFHRDRPAIPLLHKVDGFSFPSGHALIGVSFYGLLIYITWHEVKNKWWRAGIIVSLALLILLISFSRIYLRVHYASDVIAGLAIGFFWLIISLWILGKFEKRNSATKFLTDQPQ